MNLWTINKAGIRLERIKNAYSYDREEIAKIIG